MRLHIGKAFNSLKLTDYLEEEEEEIWWEIWGDGTACGPEFESPIHKIGHDKTSDSWRQLALDKKKMIT